VKAGSGHRAHPGQGGQGFSRGQLAPLGHFGHTGGTILDFNMYKSSCPRGISLLRISIPSFILKPKWEKTITANNKMKSDVKHSFII
jgi:hypothetical protein